MEAPKPESGVLTRPGFGCPGLHRCACNLGLGVLPVRVLGTRSTKSTERCAGPGLALSCSPVIADHPGKRVIHEAGLCPSSAGMAPFPDSRADLQAPPLQSSSELEPLL